MTTATPSRWMALLGLLRKETYHILRDRRTLIVITLIPVVQVIIFGYAIRTDVTHVRLAIVDPSPDYATLALRGRFGATDVFQIVDVARTASDIDRLFQRDEAQEAVVFEPGFGARLGQGVPARVQIITDATEPNTGSAIQAYALQVIQQYERELQPTVRGVHIVPQ